MVFFPINHIPPTRQVKSRGPFSIHLSSPGSRSANQIPDRMRANIGRLNTNSKAIASASTFSTFANATKVGYTIACTLARLGLVFLGFVSLILPITYLIHKMSLNSKELSISDAASSAIKAGNIERSGSEELPLNSSKNSVQVVEQVIPNIIVELEKCKVLSRKNLKIRERYFNHFNRNVENIFSTEAMVNNFKIKEEDVDKELLKLSHESYVNLTLAYRFDGQAMVNRTIALMNFNEMGESKKVNYRVDKFFQEEQGLVGYGLIPLDPESEDPPRLVFRGTNSSFFVNGEGKKETLAKGIRADLAPDIGKESYEKRQRDIGAWLKNATKNGTRKAFVSGHSLGGSFAQRVAADLSLLVREVITFCSPRLKTHPVIENQEMKITHVIMTGDLLVTRAGGGRFSRGTLLSTGQNKSEVVLISGGSHTSKILSNYCLRGSLPKKTRKISVEIQLKRDLFWSSIINFIRPQVSIA